MGNPATGTEFDGGNTVVIEDTITPAPEQTPDTPGNDENKDGLTGGQATADVPGDILGV